MTTQPNGAVPNDSVIHDIGFRHYDGPRLGRGWAFRSLLLETLRGITGSDDEFRMEARLLLGTEPPRATSPTGESGGGSPPGHAG